MKTPALSRQPKGLSWPTQAWPRSSPPRGLADAMDPLLQAAFGEVADPRLGDTHAVLIIREGQMLFERYGKGWTPDRTQPSWSMAKSITHALAGLMVKDGLVAPHAPADAPEWRSETDPRSGVTFDHLMRMSSGLRFTEDYVDSTASDVLEMLYGSGKGDTAAYAASLPLDHAPGTTWSYASGTTNILSRALAIRSGRSGVAFHAFMRERLFDKIGMRSAIPKFDSAGTFIGSSYCFCTPEDFARFGYLYLRDGMWNDERILPEGWVDYARTATTQPEDWTGLGYGAHWWLGLGGEGSFSANGFEGQFTLCLPDCDGLIVRSGKTPLGNKDDIARWMGDLARALRSG